MKTVFLLLNILFFCGICCIAQDDIHGAKDHPLITRYPGAGIRYYEVQKYKPYKVAIGPVVSYKKIDKWITAEGKLTRIYYIIKGESGLTEVYRNYLSALQNGGFSILASGVDDKNNVSKDVGGRTFLGVAYAANMYPVNKDIQLLNGSSTSGGSFYIASRLEKNGGRAYVVVGATQYKADTRVVMVDIIEEKAMETGLIKVNAQEMMNGIKASGKVALYGIYFDLDKAEVKPGSKPTLDEIAALLQHNPSLSVFVVGHTDVTGSLDHNMDLSARRARAIVNELTGNYKIASSRLTDMGVGPLCPVATNETEDGRKLNRRVELVARK